MQNNNNIFSILYLQRTIFNNNYIAQPVSAIINTCIFLIKAKQKQ